MQAIVDDLVVTYVHKGKGKVVLLLHGWGDNHRTFSSLANKLAKRFEVIALDLPGFGQTQAPKTVWNLDNYAEFVADFLRKMKVDETYAIIGHSNGGGLAIRGLATRALSAQKLILLASAGVRNTNKTKKLILKVIAKTGKVATFWLPQHYRQMLQKKLYGTIGSEMFVIPTLKETFKQTVAQDVQADAARLTLPSLLIFANNDPAVPLADGERFHELIKGSELIVIESKDHFIHHAESAKVESLIEEFL